MKKTYLMAAAIFGGTLSFAQVASHNATSISKTGNGSAIVNHIRPATNDDRAFIIFSDDCSNAANWTFNNTSTPALDWYVETNPDVNSITPTALGASLATFNSATAANGYLMINSDNAGAGVTIQAQARITLPVGALAAEPNVKLRFSHEYRWYQDTRGVRISIDGGATWTDFEITDMAGYTLGYSSGLQESGNPQVESIDISSIAGSFAGALMIEFYYDDNAEWGWFWAVDDVEVIRTEDDDLEVKTSYFGSVGATGTFYDYHMVPQAQIAPITFSANVKNIGLVDQTNVIFNVDVNSGGLALASAPITSVVGVTDSVSTTATYTPAGTLGASTFAMSITADQTDLDPTNNMISDESMEITEYTYGRDNGTEEGGISNVTGNTGNEMSIGNIMSVFADGQVGALDIKITSTASNEGGVMYGAVYVLNAAGDAYDYLGQTENYTVVANDLDQWIKVVFDSPIAVTAGQELLVLAGHTGVEVRFASAQPALPESVLGFTGDGLFNLTGASVIMVRMDMRDFTGVENSEELSNSVNVYPNPASDNVNVVYSVTEASNVSVVVTTITGEVVYSNNLGTVTAGSHIENINASTMANGVYFYTLTVNGNAITKKLVISKK